MDRRVKAVQLPRFSGREIVISDIHGDLRAYEMLLAKVGYKPNEDRLILLGDLVEKGPDNLALLHKVMKQVKEENVHVLMGNCDFSARNILYSYRLPFILDVISKRRSLLREMAALIDVDPWSVDPDDFAALLREHFLPELCFLNDLPHVIETPERLYAHSGVKNETTFGSDFREVMTDNLFLEHAPAFSKPLVVGHMPVSEYCRHIAGFDPVFDASKNIWSIDGGCQVKTSGQLNALIFQGAAVSTVSWDALPACKVLEDVRPGIQNPLYVSFNHGKVDVLERNACQLLVHSHHLHRTFWMDAEFYRNGKATEFTNYQMPLEKGNVIKLVRVWSDKALIKKSGRLGWTYAACLEPV